MDERSVASRDLAGRIELWILGALLFVLPTFEAPKNILTVAFLLLWVGRRIGKVKLNALRPDAVMTIVFVMVAVSACSTLVNSPFPNGAQGLIDTVRITLCFLAIYLGGYNSSQHFFLAKSIVAGLAFSVAFGIWELATKRATQLELHSVGVLTQSSMYVAAVLVLVAGVLAVRKPVPAADAASPSMTAFWVAGGVVAGVGLIVMASRGAVLALGIALFIAALALKKRAVWFGLAIAVALAASALTIAVSLDYSHPIITSMKARVSLSRFGDSNRERTGYVRVAVEQFRQGDSPWLGLGPRNFRSVNVKGLKFDPPLQLNEVQQRHVAHAHNMFLTKLVEEGVIGLAAIVAFFAFVIFRLIAQYRSGAYMDWRWFGALGAVIVPLVAGQANTPFYQEHAMLEMILIAIFLSGDRAMRLHGASHDSAHAAPG